MRCWPLLCGLTVLPVPTIAQDTPDRAGLLVQARSAVDLQEYGLADSLLVAASGRDSPDAWMDDVRLEARKGSVSLTLKVGTVCSQTETDAKVRRELQNLYSAVRICPAPLV